MRCNSSPFLRAVRFVFFCLMVGIIPGVARAEPDTPVDTPIPVVLDSVEEWAAGGGLLYWADSCFAQEFPPPSVIKRKPIAGGTVRTLETTTAETCLTYLNMAAAEDGVYYYDSAEGRLERIPVTEPSTPEPLVPISSGQQPNGTLKIADDFLYWVSFNAGAVLRAPRDGGTIETVVSGVSSPTDVMVIGNTVYWIDSSGVWTIQISCDNLPCTDTKQSFSSFAANTSGHGLLYRSGSGITRFSYFVEWVERTSVSNNSDYKVRRRTCSTLIPCGDTTTIYNAATNWVIGNLITDGANLFWSERFFNVSTPDGKIRRKPVGAGDAVDIVTNRPSIDRRLAIANGNLYFAVTSPTPGSPQGIFSLPLNASAITRDFRADAWEITQGIQNTANAAPLVAQKTTYVRLYGLQLDGPPSITVDARLYGTRNGVSLPGSPLSPVNGVRPLKVGGVYDRVRLNDGWYFLLPQSWTEGSVTLRAEIDPRRDHTDPNRDNNVVTSVVAFQKQPPVCVWTVPVRTHTPLPKTTDPNFWEMVDRFEARWPIPDVWIYRDTSPVEELQLCWAGPFPYPCFGPYELEDGWSISNGIPDRDKVIASLWMRAQLSFNPDACDDISAPVHFMGMVHPAANNGGAAGYASTISKQSWVQLPPHTPVPAPQDWFEVRAGSVMAQELAHNFGRKHVNCNNPDNIDNNYPYPPCQIANTGATSYYGFDVRTRTPIAPNTAADFMSYAGRTWVSDYTWRALLNAFAAAVSGAQTADLAAENVVYATGFVDMAIDDGQLNYLLVLPSSSLPPQTLARAAAGRAVAHEEGPHAVYKLRLRGADNAILHEEALTLTLLDDHSAESDPALFLAVFNAPTQPVAKVELLADDKVIDALTPGTGKPILAVQKPTNAAVIDANLVIEWTASDPDAEDELLFTVQYSYNGGLHWHTLISDFPASPTGVNTLALADLGSLHGSSGQTALIRVIASDGYNTTIANSQLFSVPNRKPEPAIAVPASNQNVPAGEMITLRGSATDPEDGGLSGAALLWAVDGSAAGLGADLAVGGLAPGSHTATLTVVDSVSNTATASVNFEIAPLGIAQGSAPQLDGFCNDSAYAEATSLGLQPYSLEEGATVRLLRTDTHLWACFSGLKKGAINPGARVGLRVDVNNSRNPLAQGDDYGFFAGENGDVLTVAGNGMGGFSAPGPGGLAAQVSSGDNSWNAELRIEAGVLGGFDHAIGLRASHESVTSAGDDYGWPYAALTNAPNTWALTLLGTLPSIHSLDPYTATVGSAAFDLAITGRNFVSGTVALWNGTALPTTVVDSEHLSATVSAARLSAAALAMITAQSPAPASFGSSGLFFVVVALPPTIQSVTPAQTAAGSPTTTITVNGLHFAANAQVLWNGHPLPTTFVNSSQLTAQIDASLLANGQTAGIVVRNSAPQEQISSVFSFEVEPLDQVIYLPAVVR